MLAVFEEYARHDCEATFGRIFSLLGISGFVQIFNVIRDALTV
jgi:hypothetical protein